MEFTIPIILQFSPQNYTFETYQLTNLQLIFMTRCMTHTLFILSLTEVLGCFYFNALIEQQWTSCARDSPSRSPEMNLLRTSNFINCCKIALWNDRTNLYCHQQYMQFGGPSGLGVWLTLRKQNREASWGSLWGGTRRGAENDGCKMISLHIQNVSTKDVQVFTMKQVTRWSSMGSS